MHKRMFMYACLTMAISLSAMDVPSAYEHADRSSISMLVRDQQENPSQRFGRQDGEITMVESTAGRIPNIKVSVPGVGPVEASLSDNQTKYLSTLAAVVVICCAWVATQKPELIMRLLDRNWVTTQQSGQARQILE